MKHHIPFIRRGFLGCLCAAALVLAAAGPAQAQMSGAIYTTEVDAYGNPTGVDVNIYSDRQDVYLDGGPTHQGSSTGLPNGNYYVQITQPGGPVLGYTETACVVVADGKFDEVYWLWGICVKASDGTQGYDQTGNAGGEYKVWISKDPTFPGNASKTDNFKVFESGSGEEPETATLTVRKFYDANANGVWDAGEVEIFGWLIEITFPDQTSTYNDTRYEAVLEPGTYTVEEQMPLQCCWVATTPRSYEITLEDGDDATLVFGNVCLGPGGGHTIGFWRNKNGQKRIDGDDIAALVELPLVGKDGSAFDPVVASDLIPWLRKAEATNMAYMLSAQLAAMVLNVREEGFVDADALVYAPGCGNTGAGNDFITIGDLIGRAVDALADPLTPAGDANRAWQECLKDALDAANNNRSFVQPSPCYFSF